MIDSSLRGTEAGRRRRDEQLIAMPQTPLCRKHRYAANTRQHQTPARKPSTGRAVDAGQAAPAHGRAA
jgi:hypothetical protein